MLLLDFMRQQASPHSDGRNQIDHLFQLHRLTVVYLLMHLNHKFFEHQDLQESNSIHLE